MAFSRLSETLIGERQFYLLRIFMRLLHVFIAFILLLMSFTPCQARQLIVLFGTDSKPPKSWKKENSPCGIQVDILREIEFRTDLTFDIHMYPWKRAYMNAIEGRGGIFGLSMTKERLKIFDYSQVMCMDEMRLITLKGHEFPFHSIQDLKDKTIGVTRGASYGDTYDNALGTVFTPCYDGQPLIRLRMLLAGRTDAALIGPGKTAITYIVRNDPRLKANIDKFSVLETPFNIDPNFIGFHKSMRQGENLLKINRALKSMWKDGTISRIVNKY
ncbi:hypothetical protein SYK_17890 [Pseudodesulfovibrio nedwellii]|uniref:Solute-binding protein family 3/N-terminal domain-containing protein n=2 Tax=Pseudodesulfovibrio nedwellii TaxID=2973072 RepID=A0ABM8B135_9BACT|nr:hypothetical protein SYK_17890 [Pseudodesulfovibrio nedwellii]